MQAWHLMQIPVQVSGASFGMDPIGQTVAQIPHFVHFSGSVFGFAFKNTAGFPAVPSGVY